MQTRRHRAVAILAALLSGLAMAAAGMQAPRPITKAGLVEALRIGGLSPEEMVQVVQKRGVDFRLSPEIEAELRDAGARAELLDAARANYRGAAPAPSALSKNEIITLLQVGTPADRVEDLVRQRRVNFTLTPDISHDLQAAGASRALLDLISASFGPARPSAPATPVAPPAPAAPAAGAPGRPAILTIKDVRRLFIQPMANDLDKFLRAEIAEQLGTHLVIVLNKEQADAIMSGAAAMMDSRGVIGDKAQGSVSVTDASGKTVLWATEAGDRGPIPFRRGGTKKVAERIVGKLKAALQIE